MISFVGAGPGAPDLITVRGARRLAVADVVVWASSLVPEPLLDHVRPGAVVHDSAGMTLEDVLAVYESVTAARPEAAVVRLHSGDPSLYGALFEQIQWCVTHGRAFEIVPGVSSFTAAAAALGCELTVPALSQSVVLTRLANRTSESVPPTESVEAFAAIGSTMAVFLSGARPAALQEALLAEGHGYPPSTPAAVVVRASWPDESVLTTTVGALAEAMKSHDTKLTALVLVGPAIATASPVEPPGSLPTGASTSTHEPSRSRLYTPDFSHRYRKRSTPGTTAGRPKRRPAQGRPPASP